MSHVDDGLLHAWIDGAFAPGDAEGDAIAAHLADCEACALRAEEARKLKERAAHVLRTMAPDAVRVEPFDRLITARRAAAQAGAAGTAATPPRRRRATMPLAWAASLMLAVTAGWLAREYLPPAATPLADGTRQSAPATPAEAPASAIVTTETDDMKSSADAVARDRAAEPGAANRTAEPPARMLGGRAGEPEQQRAADVAGAGSRVDALAEAERREAVAKLAVQETMVAAAPPPVALARQSETARRRSDADSNVAQPREAFAPSPASNEAIAMIGLLDSAQWVDVARADAERLLGRAPFIIDGLAVEAMQAIEPQRTVRVGQRTTGGALIELVQRRGPLRLQDERAVGAARSNVAMAAEISVMDVLADTNARALTFERDGLVLVVRAPIPADSLRALLARVR